MVGGTFRHREAGPQLVLHAYLQRVVNSGGRIGREYAVGRQRTDLLVEWPLPRDRNPARMSKHVIECKVLRGKSGLESIIREGQMQTAEYMDRCGAESGHLLIFDMIPASRGRSGCSEGIRSRSALRLRCGDVTRLRL